MTLARSRWAIALAALALLVLLGPLAGCRSRRATPRAETEEATEANPSSPAEGPPAPEVRYFRRLLFIQISEYAFLNRFSAVAPHASDRTKSSAELLARALRVPFDRDSQLFILSDTAPPPDSKLPTRAAVVAAYERFFRTSSPHDRIAVYFSGHATEVGGKAYLVPIEGDRNDPNSLIPVEDFYAAFQSSPAVQKVAIWDVCRFNRELGRERPGSEPMTSSLFKALSSVPEGIEAVIACQAGENAQEFDNLPTDSSTNLARFSGSALLESLRHAADKRLLSGKSQNPNEPIAVADLVGVTGKRVAEMVASPRVGAKQTVRYFPAMSEPVGELPTTPSPSRPVPAKTASPEVLAIVEEFRVPPIKSGLPATALAEFPFRNEVIAAYKADVPLEEVRKNKEKYAFRNVVLNAIQTIRDVWVFKAKGGLQQRETIAAPISNDLKKDIKRELDAWGIGIARLEEADLALEKLAAKKKDQPRRWQANYDFARATVKSRLAYMNEYDKLMGDVLTETVPPLDKATNQNAYRLTSSEKMKSKKDVQKIAEDARAAFAALIAEYKDTPWALEAAAEKSIPLGMVWQPYSRPK